jgi:GH43 family beta-xylosidase
VSAYGDFSSQCVVTVLDATPPPDVLFTDDFADNAAEGWSTYGGVWSVSEGQYAVNSGAGYKAVLDKKNFTDFSLEADVKITSGDEAGLIFRASNLADGANALDGYYLGIHAADQSSVLGKMTGGNWTELASRKLPIHQNQWYHLKINANENHIQVYIDDNPLNVNGYPKFDLVDDTHLATGKIGLRTWNADARFDNVKVSSYRENFSGPTYTNSVLPDIADPYVLYYQGTYYLYGTTTNWSNTSNGIKVYTSKDLVNWTEHEQLALNKADSWGNDRFWAPEVREKDGTFYMYYAVEERLAVATSQSPLGPFVQEVKQPMHPDIGEIDAHVFTDDNGKRYMYFVRFNNGNEIWAAELNDDMKTIKEDTLKFVIKPTQEWELSQKRPVASINEGPFVIKHNGTYYLTYSGNHFESPDYGVGYATAPTPMGPWTKYAYNPIMKSNSVVPGAGHHSLIYSPDGSELFMVYHTHYNVSTTEPRKLAIDRVHFVPQESGPDAMEVWGPTITPQLMPSNVSTPTPIPVAVTSIQVTGQDGVTSITAKGGSLQMVAEVLPENATDKSVTWSIESGSDHATLSSTGLLTAIANGTVRIQATSVRSPSVSQISVITITGQTASDDNSGGGGGHNSNGRGDTTTPTPTVPPAQRGGNTLKLSELKPDANGVAVAKVDSSSFQNAVNRALDKTIVIQVQVSDEAKEVAVVLTIEQLHAAQQKGIETIALDLGGVTLSFKPGQFTNRTKPTGNVQLSAEKVNTAALTEEVRKVVGDHPVYDFHASVDGEKVSTFGNGGINVAMDYKLKPGEDPNTIVAYYMKDSGELEIVKHAKYNVQTGKLEFNVSHFSKYAAVSRTVAFNDLASAAWAKQSIEALAAREIVDGTGNNAFAPFEKVTRAEFIKMLMNAFDLAGDKEKSSFSDVKEGAWYYNSIASAQKLGIIQGKDDGSFGIDDAISREDMAVMAYRASQLAKVNLQANVGSVDFADQSQIASYAAESVAAMQKAGVINGIGNSLFAPKDDASRAEAAKIIYSLFTLTQ